MTALLLKSANASRPGNRQWDADDYDVRDDGGRVVGRIMKHPQAPKDQPWFWTIVDGIPPSIENSRRCGDTRGSDGRLQDAVVGNRKGTVR